jgi:hypothetical protein
MPDPHRLLAACVTCLFCLGCLGLSGCGGSGKSTAAADDPDPGPHLTSADEARTLAYFKTLLRGEAGRQQSVAQPAPPPAASPAAGEATSDAANLGAGVTFSGTTVQEVGVDEDDLVKSDGRAIYSVDAQRSRVRLAQVQPAAPQLLERGSLDAVPDNALAIEGLHLDADLSRLAVVAGSRTALDIYGQWFQPDMFARRESELSVWDVATVGDQGMNAARLLYRMRIGGQLIGSRRIGNLLYLVLRYRPAVAELASNGSTSGARDTAIEAVTAQQLLPEVSIDGAAARPLLTPAACWIQEENLAASADVVLVITVDLAAGSPPARGSCFVGGSEALYVSPRNLYLATTRSRYQSGSALVYPVGTTTDIHKFGLDGAVSYRGSAEVDGHLGWDQNRKSFRLGEFGDHLGVISFTGSEGGMPLIAPVPAVTPVPGPAATTNLPTASPATLTVLREDGSATLATVGSLPNPRRPALLGKAGEQLYASRFLGSRAFLVTYRLTDPLYVLDLSDPTDPKVAGELEVSGYSDYLFPLTENLLLGIGKEAVETGDGPGDGRFAWYQGVKVSLIDVSNPADPREVAKQQIGGRGSHSTVLQNHHGLALLRRDNQVRIALPVNVHGPASGATDGGVEPSRYLDYTHTGLYRYEIDVAARSMVARSAIVAPSPASSLYGDPDISDDRAVLVDEQVHYLRGGGWLSAWW